MHILREGWSEVDRDAAGSAVRPTAENRTHPSLKPTRSQYEQAVELLGGFEDQAVDQYWNEASTRGCDPVLLDAIAA
ncbi:hypothetical protein PMHK_00970 [Pseudomonas sp. MHK4]